MTVIGCKWTGNPEKVQPDDFCHRCPLIPHSYECLHYREAHQAIFVYVDKPIKAVVLSRDKLIKIRYNNPNELPDLLTELRKIPNLEIDIKGYTG